MPLRQLVINQVSQVWLKSKLMRTMKNTLCLLQPSKLWTLTLHTHFLVGSEHQSLVDIVSTLHVITCVTCRWTLTLHTIQKNFGKSFQNSKLSPQSLTTLPGELTIPQIMINNTVNGTLSRRACNIICLEVLTPECQLLLRSCQVSNQSVEEEPECVCA